MSDTRIRISRRCFLGASVAAGFGLGLGLFPTPAQAVTPAAGLRPNVFVEVAPSGLVTIICHRSEMGQGIRNTVPMILADEMDADWKRVKVEQALGDHKTYGNQLTDGSTSIREQLQMLREAGATVRDLLERAAATHWQAPREQVEAQFHEVIHKTSGRRVGYGELVKVAQSLPAAPATGARPRGRFTPLPRSESCQKAQFKIYLDKSI